MDLSQVKLSKKEWENIEAPVSENEKRILSLICKGYTDVNIRENYNLSLVSFIKMEHTPDNEIYLYQMYFEKDIQEASKKFNYHSPNFNNTKLKKTIKKIDKMRIDNMEKNIEYNKNFIFEFLLVDFASHILRLLPTKEHGIYLYSLIQFKKSSIQNINKYVQSFVDAVINYANQKTNIRDIIHSAHHFIERNPNLIKYEDLTLFKHQQELFSLFNGEESKTQPRLVLYIAPTGTGKTLSPLGLSQGYKIIFVCVARHIGLSLAKSAVSMGKHIAFAFGCETASDIRLHNYSASSFIKNNKSGGIYKIDNTVGDKVEIIICDVKSYIVAMHYMLSFNMEDEIITYWDEPTITMDYETHELHETIHKNWVQNKISKMVLSCATLPKQEEITATIVDFQTRFAKVETLTTTTTTTTTTEEETTTTKEVIVNSIISYDCKKSISIINENGKCVLPHLIFPNYRDVLKCVEHCLKNKTLLRYFDLGEIVKFIEYVIDNNCIDQDNMDKYAINHWFGSISDITMLSLKVYYLEVLGNLEPSIWENTYLYLS
jgi:hypothetical protein